MFSLFPLLLFVWFCCFSPFVVDESCSPAASAPFLLPFSAPVILHFSDMACLIKQLELTALSTLLESILRVSFWAPSQGNSSTPPVTSSSADSSTPSPPTAASAFNCGATLPPQECVSFATSFDCLVDSRQWFTDFPTWNVINHRSAKPLFLFLSYLVIKQLSLSCSLAQEMQIIHLTCRDLRFIQSSNGSWILTFSMSVLHLHNTAIWASWVDTLLSSRYRCALHT